MSPVLPRRMHSQQNELTEIDASKVDQKIQKEISGGVDWVATRNKYFAVALIPLGSVSEGAYLEGTRVTMPENGFLESYGISLKMPYRGEQSEKSIFKIFLGPLQHDELKSYGTSLEKNNEFGMGNG